jgi:hypothetical protein
MDVPVMRMYRHSATHASGCIVFLGNGLCEVSIRRGAFSWSRPTVPEAWAQEKLRDVHRLFAEEQGWPRGGRWTLVGTLVRTGGE